MVAPFILAEIASQPDCWGRAARAVADNVTTLPQPGESVAVVGCGSSAFMASAYARLREGAGQGPTDAFAASELPPGRPYDRVLAISRSGTTTEVLDVMARVAGRAKRVAITAVPQAPIADVVEGLVVLDYADERSVVQTRFATTCLALLRSSLGADLQSAIADARQAVTAGLDGFGTARQFTFLGTGWTLGLAQEAALKMREAAQVWTEAYAAMEYRHGPISIAEPGRVVWMFGSPPPGLAGEVARTGATFVQSSPLDPMAHLVLAQRLAVEVAAQKGLDPDSPRHLSRSVILDSANA